MNNIQTTLKEFWEVCFPKAFENGLITYERQLQSELFCWLKQNLGENYKVWVEPFIKVENSSINKSIPDLIITYDNEVKAIIEIKFSITDKPLNYDGDLKKLINFDDESKNNHQLIFGYIPDSSSETIQFLQPESTYILNSNHLNVFIIFGFNSIDLIRLKDGQNPASENGLMVNSLNNLTIMTGWFDSNFKPVLHFR